MTASILKSLVEKTSCILLTFAMASACRAQKPIGIIDFYGLDKVSKEAALNVLGVKEGDTLRLSTDSLERRLMQLNGVVEAAVTRICCVEGKPVLFVGIQEKGLENYPLKKIEGKPLRLPAVITKRHDAFLAALKVAVSKGDNGDDFSLGHSLNRNPAVKRVQQGFVPLADKYFTQLANVLQHAASESQREVAADVIAYAIDKQNVADQYYEALTDPSPKVRNNVFRALAGLGIYATSHPHLRLKYKADVFVWLLNSPVWSDRNKAMFSLVSLTEKRDSSLLQSLQQGATASLIEMAKWKSKGHAVLAYILLGRIAGLTEDEIFSTWNKNRLEAVFSRLTNQ